VKESPAVSNEVRIERLLSRLPEAGCAVAVRHVASRHDVRIERR
jgi:hypothetical protein